MTYFSPLHYTVTHIDIDEPSEDNCIFHPTYLHAFYVILRCYHRKRFKAIYRCIRYAMERSCRGVTALFLIQQTG